MTRKVTDEEKPKTVEIESSMDAFDANSFDYIDSLLGTAKAPSPELVEMAEEELEEPQQEEPANQSNGGHGSEVEMDMLTTSKDSIAPVENFVIPEGE